MEVPKDVYEYLMNFADDRTILNMLSVNKEFRDEKFFKRVMERRYPSAIKFKSSKQTWKQYYIEIVYYVERIYELIGYRYSIDAKRSPEGYYVFIKNNLNDLYKILKDVIIEGNLTFVKLLVGKGIDINKFGNQALRLASSRGNLDIVKYLVEHGADIHFNDAPVYNAALYGHFDILKYLIEKGATVDLNGSLRVAEKYNHPEVVKYLKSL